jgi:small subunit ribosomal protein S2
MALPEFTLRQLLEAGVHFGHQTQRWNPRMEEFIYGERNGIHIMDLTQTVPMLDAALNVARETVAKGGRILFVGTKRQASTAIAEAAEKCAQYYMNHRWLGGTLTNWQTVSQSINRLKALDEKMATGSEGLTKKERLGMEREQSKLQASLGGITQMGGVPDLLFVIDVKKEALAVAEANKLGIPVIAVVDTNCSPSGVDYIIPGNDDAARAISLYCDLIARSALDGMTEQMGAAGVDLGEMENVPLEPELGDDTGKEEIAEAVAADPVVTEEEKPESEPILDEPLVAEAVAADTTAAEEEKPKKEKAATKKKATSGRTKEKATQDKTAKAKKKKKKKHKKKKKKKKKNIQKKIGCNKKRLQY